MPDIVSRVPIDPLLEALIARLGPLAERRIPVYHLDEIEAVAQALASAWSQAAPADLLAQLSGHPAGEHVLAPAVVREEDGLLLRIVAPELVCRAFDDAAGHLDSHTEFGR